MKPADQPKENEATEPPSPPRKRQRLRSLPLLPRIAIFVAGWTLILIGIAGLVLPGIQGIASILAGAALLSLISELIFNLLGRLMQRWPKQWRKVQAARLRLYRRLRRRFR